jgi:hypothetical protein
MDGISGNSFDGLKGLSLSAAGTKAVKPAVTKPREGTGQVEADVFQSQDSLGDQPIPKLSQLKKETGPIIDDDKKPPAGAGSTPFSLQPKAGAITNSNGTITTLEESPKEPESMKLKDVNFLLLLGLDDKEHTPAGPRLKTDYSAYRLEALSNPSLVGREAYGPGLVKTFHKGVNDTPGHEKSQAQAYEKLSEYIGKGLVDPSSFGASMVKELGVSPEPEEIPGKHSQISGLISKELKGLVDSNALLRREARHIQEEIDEYSSLYREVYPNATPEKVYRISRDNALKLAYQAKADKSVLAGSDHGTRHILEGNMKFASQIVESLREKGGQVSRKDELLIHQAIIDHDIGYTAGCARIGQNLGAMTDHPVFSARFIEDNKDYYADAFGKDGYETLKDSVLNHSYVPAVPDFASHDAGGLNPAAVRYVSAISDCLGVTAETKVNELFRKPEAVKTLLKMRLALEAGADSEGNGLKSLPHALAKKYHQELLDVAGTERNPQKADDYKKAVEGFFTEFNVHSTLGQYTGVVDGVAMEKQFDGTFKPRVEMHLSKISALLGNMFGPELETKAFAKAMGDFDMPQDKIDQLGEMMVQKRKGTQLDKYITLESDKAVFNIDHNQSPLDFAEDRHVLGTVKDFHNLSIRKEIRNLLQLHDNIVKHGESGTPRTIRVMSMVKSAFESAVEERTTAKELKQLSGYLEDLGKDPKTAGKARDSLKHFLTGQEREYMGLSLMEARVLGVNAGFEPKRN